MTAATKARTSDDDAATESPKADEPRDPESEGADERSPYAEFIDYGDTVTTITFHGAKFTFPAKRGNWPTRAVQAFQRGHHTDGVEMLLGAQQWDRFNEVAPTLSEFWEFVPYFAEAAGFLIVEKNDD